MTIKSIFNKQLFIITVAIYFPLLSTAQNLVPNPSFELFDSTNVYGTTGPASGNPLHYFCADWFEDRDCISTAYVFSPLLPPPFSAPAGAFGFSNAYDGNSYAGYNVFYTSPTNGRPAAQTKLTSPLVYGYRYELSFYYKYATDDTTNLSNHTAVDNLGGLFKNDSITCWDTQNLYPNTRTTPGVILKSYEWHKFTGNFVAQGGESFLALGCFGPENSITTDYNGGLYGAIYLFDSISVIQKERVIPEISWNLSTNIITPNGDGKNDIYTFDHIGFKTIDIDVFNRWGNLVYTYDYITSSWKGQHQNGSQLSEGVYYLSIKGKDILDNTWNGSKMVTLVR